jgi:hypothetical protein
VQDGHDHEHAVASPLFSDQVELPHGEGSVGFVWRGWTRIGWRPRALAFTTGISLRAATSSG